MSEDVIKFDKDEAVKESANFLKELLLRNPETNKEMFVATDVTMNEDGSVSIICIEDIDSDKAVMHTIYSGYVEKGDDAQSKEDESIITPKNSGKIIGLDGQPIA